MSPEGLWLYSVADGKVQLVAEGAFSDLIWAADDTAIYGIRYKDDNVHENETEVWQYDIGSILSPSAMPVL